VLSISVMCCDGAHCDTAVTAIKNEETGRLGAVVCIVTLRTLGAGNSCHATAKPLCPRVKGIGGAWSDRECWMAYKYSCTALSVWFTYGLEVLKIFQAA
jgi:hypothetical protein